MIRMINRLTGGDMWVSEDRKDEYLAAGHKLAASAGKEPAEAEAAPKEKKGAPKTSRKKKG